MRTCWPQYGESDDVNGDDEQFAHDLDIDSKVAGSKEYFIEEVQATMMMDYSLNLSNDLQPAMKIITKECKCINSLIFVDILLAMNQHDEEGIRDHLKESKHMFLIKVFQFLPMFDLGCNTRLESDIEIPLSDGVRGVGIL